MSINQVREKLMTGGVADTINVLPDYKRIQISISGRTSGIITITGTADGGEGPEPIEDKDGTQITIDLSVRYTVIIDGAAMTQLTMTPDVAGDDYTVKISQWPH